MDKEAIEYKLPEDTKLEFSAGGDLLKATFVLLKAPAKKDRRLILKLNQYLCIAKEEAIQNTTEQENNLATKEAKKIEQEISQEDSIKIYSELIKRCLMTSTKIDINDAFDIFERLLLQVGSVEGTEALRADSLKRIDDSSIMNMLGDYLANFTIVF